MIGIGKFGNIKKMMKTLSRRESHIDLEFICGPQKHVLLCHRFIVSAQSNFLKNLVLQTDPDLENRSKIYLPDIQPQHMEIVLQFLYTGKMKLGFDAVEPVRELLVKLLRIDADFKLPFGDPSLLRQNSDQNPDNDQGPSKESHENNGSGDSNGGSSNPPPAKRFRSNSNQSQQRPNSNGLQDACPMSPPHELSHDFSDDEDVRVLTPPPKTPPTVVDLSDNEATQEEGRFMDPVGSVNEQEDKNEETNNTNVEETNAVDHDDNASDVFEGLHLTAAPKIITKKTAPHLPPKKYFCRKSTTQVPKAPGFIAKRTGKRKEKKRAAKQIEDGIESGQAVANTTDSSHEKASDKSESNSIESDIFQRSTRTSSGSISKSTYLEDLSDEDDLNFVESTPQVPMAPSFLAKRTGKRGRKSITEGSETETTNVTAVKEVEQEAEVVPVDNGEAFTFLLHGEKDSPASGTERTTRTKSGARSRTTYAETFSDDEEYTPIDDDIADPSFERVSSPQSPPLLDLPPPLPEAPEPGCVLYRGDWTKTEKVQRIKNRSKFKSSNGKVKKYNPNFLTITGKSLKDTAKNRAAPTGEFKCSFCGNVYEKEVSLQSHISRNHNTKSRVPCPENCGKLLTCKAAIAKHLLSHRERSEWPFRCEFCGKQFQARADIPKHWMTDKHKDDPRIPKKHSEAWREVLARSQILPNLKKMKKAARDSIMNSSLSSPSHLEAFRNETPTTDEPAVPSAFYLNDSNVENSEAKQSSNVTNGISAEQDIEQENNDTFQRSTRTSSGSISKSTYIDSLSDEEEDVLVESTPQVPRAPNFLGKRTGKRGRPRLSERSETDPKDVVASKEVEQEAIVVPVANGETFTFLLHGEANVENVKSKESEEINTKSSDKGTEENDHEIPDLDL